LTLVTERRVRFLTTDLARPILHDAIATAAFDRPFELVACVLLPDHLHLVMTLPTGDSNFSTRVAAIKARFTRAYLATVSDAETAQSMSRDRQGYRNVWQKRFWEHTVRDRDDLIGCLDYVHYNPVKHGLVRCPHQWPWSTFTRHLTAGRYFPNWHCTCESAPDQPPPRDLPGAEMDS
jgi:putative transposase